MPSFSSPSKRPSTADATLVVIIAEVSNPFAPIDDCNLTGRIMIDYGDEVILDEVFTFRPGP